MSTTVEVPDVERVTFFSGQRLTASDLTALERRQRELRWLHNRSLHSWGVASGFSVSGRRGDTVVTVEPGYGTDERGREILLDASQTLDVPAVAAAGGGEAVYYLVAAYVGDAQQDTLETREGICHPGGAVRVSDDPLLAWRKHKDVDEGIHLVLARAWVRNCRLSRDVDTKVRRVARFSAHPYVAAGQTPAGSTEWQAWTVDGQMVGVFTSVSTVGARFHGLPRYVFELAGRRYLEASPGPLLAMPFAGLADTSADGFTLRVLLPKVGGTLINPAALRKANSTPQLVREQLRWHVQWMGIEG